MTENIGRFDDAKFSGTCFYIKPKLIESERSHLLIANLLHEGVHAKQYEKYSKNVSNYGKNIGYLVI